MPSVPAMAGVLAAAGPTQWLASQGAVCLKEPGPLTHILRMPRPGIRLHGHVPHRAGGHRLDAS